MPSRDDLAAARLELVRLLLRAAADLAALTEPSDQGQGLAACLETGRSVLRVSVEIAPRPGVLVCEVDHQARSAATLAVYREDGPSAGALH